MSLTYIYIGKEKGFSLPLLACLLWFWNIKNSNSKVKLSINNRYLQTILFYHLKSYFIYYIILFYNTPNISSFIFHIKTNTIYLLLLWKNTIYLFIYLFSLSSFLAFSLFLSISLTLYSLVNIEHHNYKHIAQTQPHNQTKKNQNLKKKKKKKTHPPPSPNCKYPLPLHNHHHKTDHHQTPITNNTHNQNTHH